jgi:hypothetical protein
MTIELVVHWIDNSAHDFAALKNGFRLLGIIPSATVVKKTIVNYSTKLLITFSLLG